MIEVSCVALRHRAAPGLPGTLTALLLLAALAVLNAIANPLTLVGPALVGLAVVALITTAPRRESAPTDAVPEPLAGPTPWRALGRLAVIPVVATPVFALLTSAPDPIPTGWLFYGVTVPLSTVLFVVAWWRAHKLRS